MNSSVGLVALVILVLLVVAAAVITLGAPYPPGPMAETPVEEVEEPPSQQGIVEELGQELLDRRVALDSRRGTLGGNTQLDAALGDLASRYESGEIDETEFEAEKVRLLSNGS